MRQIILNTLKENSISILKLSKETGIRYPTLTEFFNGNKGLSFEHLQTVCDCLELN